MSEKNKKILLFDAMMDKRRKGRGTVRVNERGRPYTMMKIYHQYNDRERLLSAV